MSARDTVWVKKWPQRAHELTLALGDPRAAAVTVSKEMGRTVSEASVRSMLRTRFPNWQTQVARGPTAAPTSPESVLRDRVKALETERDELGRRVLTDERVKREILRMAAGAPHVPAWVERSPRKSGSGPGVPCVLASDWHWAEVVEAGQVFGKNAYDLATAQRRARAFFENTVDLLKRHTVRPEFPGIVVAVAGDMLSGTIHEELEATNEVPIMRAVIDLRGVWQWGLRLFQREFGRVFCVWVRGNHTRTTKKPIAKNAAHTSYDWLVGKLLEGDLASEEIGFLVPDSAEAYFSVAGHRYFLTHGDAWRGGDGIIGPIGPIFRGDSKTRARNAQVEMGYDTLLCGHFHQLMQLQRLIVNGSLKGLDEWAWKNGFPFEPPRQALWLTHPTHGITISMPVLVERGEKRTPTTWASAAA